jgi:hypothetical protein
MTKKTPEELRQLRIDSLAKARAAKGKKQKPQAAAAAAQPQESRQAVPAEFLGITKSDCPIDCTADRCVISGKPVCAHPCKGGLQPVHMLDQAAVERYQRAHKHLAHVELDRRQ